MIRGIQYLMYVPEMGSTLAVFKQLLRLIQYLLTLSLNVLLFVKT